MDLNSLIAKDKIIEIEHPALEGFKVKIAYISRDLTRKLVDKATITKYNNKSHKPEEEIDNDLFLKLYTSALVKGWTGLKLKYLPELVPTDLGEANEEEELDYTEDNALVLMKNSQDFDTWLSSVVSDIKNFNKSN